jgi:hypothetical protein
VLVAERGQCITQTLPEQLVVEGVWVETQVRQVKLRHWVQQTLVAAEVLVAETVAAVSLF